ncbi:MAG: TIGR00282 family metallophosphoesterase [Anaerotruncus sp.]|jgi:metallophosphoesterase (TIGR00282 family)|nr:TIGR00282 family metallophosphoesterase [Anaerotruncus sp.]
MNILFLGDVVGQAGCEQVRKELPRLRQKYQAQVVIANGENSAEGNGITPHSAKYLFDSGVDVLTTGNHVLRRREIYGMLEQCNGLLRPANYHPSAPGEGMYFYDSPQFPLCVINLQGRVYIDPAHQSPFDCVDELLKKAPCKNIIVDFHAEATGEKYALARYLDGRVSAVLGTHTHIQTADEQLLPHGTAYISDVGMCGGRNSILGVLSERVITRMRTGMPIRFVNDPEQIELHGVLLEFAQEGKVERISRFTV